jgi:hypothetical protein
LKRPLNLRHESFAPAYWLEKVTKQMPTTQRDFYRSDLMVPDESSEEGASPCEFFDK